MKIKKQIKINYSDSKTEFGDYVNTKDVYIDVWKAKVVKDVIFLTNLALA